MNDTERIADVRAMEERRRVAMLAADSDTLREILDEGLIYIHSSGARDSRESYLGKLDDGVVRYEALALEITEIQARERFALLRGEMDASVRTPSGVLAVASHYEAVWMRTGNAWRVVALHGFPRDTTGNRA